MAMIPTVVPPYPDVPKGLGIPPVLRQVGAVVNTVQLIAADAKILLQALFGGPQWGIFTPKGAAVLMGDSVVGVDHRREWRIADYPREDGSFASYDKVTEPFDVRVTFACSGESSILSSILSGGVIGSLLTGSTPGITNRRKFLTELDRVAGMLDLYTVITPEFSFKNCNIVHYDYRREVRKGGTLIEIDVWLRQILQLATKAFTTPPPPKPAPTPATPTTPSPGTASGSASGTATTGTSTPTPSTGNAQAPAAVDPTSTGTVQSATPATGEVPSTVRYLSPGESGYSAGLNNPMTNLSPKDYAAFAATVPG